MPKGENLRKLSDTQRVALVEAYTTPNPDGTWNGAKTLGPQFGITPTAVYLNLRRDGVMIRDSRTSHGNGKRCKPITRLPQGVPPLCKCGCGEPVQWEQRRDRWYVYVPGHYRNPAAYKDRDWLDMEYTIKGRTLTEIATECGVCAGTITKFMKKFGIARRTTSASLILNESVRGYRNPAFKDGRGKWEYSSEWKRLSREIRNRDNYTCRVCGVYLPPPSKRLHVHHIDSDRFNNADSNLVTVCWRCHPKGERAEAEFAAHHEINVASTHTAYW